MPLHAGAVFLALVSFWAATPGTPACGASDPSKNPRMVILIRHGEKPPKTDHSPHLNPTGVERAQRLPLLFSPGRSAVLPPPDVLFATHASASSNREYETLHPLAQALHLEINTQYGEDDVAGLTSEILSGKCAGKVVLVCWHHEKIAAIAAALGVPDPPAWPGSTFDRLWKIQWLNRAPTLTNLPESLLPGDSQRPGGP